jgi:hypothetical protein
MEMKVLRLFVGDPGRHARPWRTLCLFWKGGDLGWADWDEKVVPVDRHAVFIPVVGVGDGWTEV